MGGFRAKGVLAAVGLGLLAGLLAGPAAAERPESAPASLDPDHPMRSLLDAPLLFVKRHSYTGIHIYDTFYKWPPGGGGIYVLENPAAPREQWRIRPVIDPTTPDTLGEGVYSYPNLSYDATRLLFCFKGEPDGNTSVYEIGIDGSGLRQLTDPEPYCEIYQGSLGGQHDVAPAYLPDGRIVFLSTRPSGLVPCNNTGVAILHVMNADGTDIHPISVNNVNEFDPAVLPDGRILFGRWEYIDKNALTIQSLWTVNPDGTNETAFYANNMVFPEAILDARPVPGSHLVVGTFAKHNAPPRGSIAMVDPHRGKNAVEAIYNFEHPDNPLIDTGESRSPWPINEDVVLFSGRPEGHTRNVLEMIDRAGRRVVIHSDPEICLHCPMLVKPQPVPPVLPAMTDRTATTGNFFVQDLYEGLEGVARGEVTHLRVIEETSRVSPAHPGGNPYNQTFLISGALGWSAKNFLGVVPVDEDGSAYFEVPAGRAVYLQALDAEGRLVQSMRTFVQAAPGTTRSCVGCHEHKSSTPLSGEFAAALTREPSQLEPESWGSGLIDYPSMVQPIFDKHCAACHGGEEGFGAGIDLTGGWTEHFSISYENLTTRRETQLIADWIAGIDCMNGTAFYSSEIFPPRSHGSGAAPLADVLVDRHPELSRAERDLLMAWIDTNGIYYGTWDYTAHGHVTQGWGEARQALIAEMHAAGCMECHGENGRPIYFEADWFNLREPERSRILRAPLAEGGEGFGAALCRNRKIDPRQQRVRLLRNGYAHAVLPVEAYAPEPFLPPDRSGEPVISFASTEDPHYQAMLDIIRRAQQQALAAPRVDMPGAEVIPGAFRQFIPPPLPEVAPPLSASVDADGLVRLSWEQSAAILGLGAEVHRSTEPDFEPNPTTMLAETPRFEFLDGAAPAGEQHYALVLYRSWARSRPAHVSITVPEPAPPAAPQRVAAATAPHAVALRWDWPAGSRLAYHVERARSPEGPFERLTEEPLRGANYLDGNLEVETPYWYVVRAVSARGVVGPPSAAVEGRAQKVEGPAFVAPLDEDLGGLLHDEELLPGQAHGSARITDGALDLTSGGHVTFPNRPEFHLAQPFSVVCWVWLDEPGQMPVTVSCGHWRQAGWFLQNLGGRWRWHVGGIDCDGGQVQTGRWVHLAASYDGRMARLYQDGSLVGEQAGAANRAPFTGPLHVGQYSAGPNPDFQTTGRIRGLALYQRPLTAAELAISSD